MGEGRRTVVTRRSRCKIPPSRWPSRHPRDPFVPSTTVPITTIGEGIITVWRMTAIANHAIMPSIYLSFCVLNGASGMITHVMDNRRTNVSKREKERKNK